jgi:hypothetical protein
MNWRGFGTQLAAGVAPLAFALSLSLLTGCGMPAVPQPPSLKLPQPVTNLAATRTGDAVHLTWTMPRRTTDKVLLKGEQAVHICRKTDPAAPCDPAADIKAEPVKAAEYTDQLPAMLTAGSPRTLIYEIELRSPAGRTAGPSNLAYVVAGAAPAPITGLEAHVTGRGVTLRWQAAPAASAVPTAVRIHRELVLPPGAAPKAKSKDISAGVPAPQEQTLEVAGNPEICLDRDAAFDKTYRYSVQRVLVASPGGRRLELLGNPSDSISVDTKDTFPPAVPADLAAVADPEGKAIDLSWTPDSEPDVAGYVVYRREAGSGGAPERISPPKLPVVAPGFRDATPVRGRRYAYSVSAVDHDGNESRPSAEVEETLPDASSQ